MKTVILLVVVVVIAAGAYWYFSAEEPVEPLRPTEERAPTQEAAPTGQQAPGERVVTPTTEPHQDVITFDNQVGQELQARAQALDLGETNVRDELEREGEIRRRAEARDVAFDQVSDERITEEVRTKITVDPTLSIFDIAVSTTDGVVTLSGTVASEEFIGRAVVLALDTDNVREVVSTITVQ